jgi:hypothetical protein
MAISELPLSAVVNGSGVATITVTVTGGIQTWTIQQISVEEPTAPAGATCVIRKNGNLITPIIPTGDTAAGDPPIILRPSDTLTIVWTGCTSGRVAKAFVMFDDGNP